MYKHINSASRVHALLQATQRQSGEIPTWSVWAEAFGVKGASDAETAELVVERLSWFHIELQLLKSQAAKVGLSTHLYDTAILRARAIASPLNLPGPWKSYQGNLTPDVLLAIAFLNELLPDEESAVDPRELEEIASLADQLAGMLASSDLPESLRKMIEHHLALISTALAQYKVFGARALREAGRTALGEIVEVKQTGQESKPTEELSRLGQLWKRVNSVADAAIKAEKVGQLGYRAWESITNWLS